MSSSASLASVDPSTYTAVAVDDVVAWTIKDGTTSVYDSLRRDPIMTLVWSFLIATALGMCGLAAAQSRAVSPYESTQSLESLLRYYLLDVFFVNPSKGWAVGGDGVLLSTIDGGRTWRQRRVASHKLWSVQFTSTANGWIAGDRGTLLRTRDGGQRWRHERAPDDGDLRRLRFVTSKDGWLIGQDALRNG